jgi:hypothetical protein
VYISKRQENISTNNIATGMVRGGRKYAFNPPKIHFRLISEKLQVMPPLRLSQKNGSF